MFFRKRNFERRRRVYILAYIEEQFRNLIKPFSRVRLEVSHEKGESKFLIHQKRGVNEEDLYSFAWLKVVWGKDERLIFSIREIHPETNEYSINHADDAIYEIGEFLRRYNNPKNYTFEVGE